MLLLAVGERARDTRARGSTMKKKKTKPSSNLVYIIFFFRTHSPLTMCNKSNIKYNNPQTPSPPASYHFSTFTFTQHLLLLTHTPSPSPPRDRSSPPSPQIPPTPQSPHTTDSPPRSTQGSSRCHKTPRRSPPRACGGGSA